MMSDPVGPRLAATRRRRHDLGGHVHRWRAPSGDRWLDPPSDFGRDGSTLVNLAWAQPPTQMRAVAAARTAFDHGVWPRLHPRARGEILQHFADLVEEHRKEVALLISLEMGKPIRDAYQIELRALIRCLRFYGELADKESGEITPTEEGELSLVTREPAGVVAAVVPWNFPLTLGGWKLAPRASGGVHRRCSRPPSNPPLSMQRVAELGAMDGLPPGCFQCDQRGRPGGWPTHLGEHAEVDVLTFTGSTEVGRNFLRYSADSNLKAGPSRTRRQVTQHHPFRTHPDLDAAADAAAWAIYFNSGEMCTAGSRLVVHADVADRVWSGS
jgi:gamma-glutamyl-gamma-aminobutyraldehyde dehydrogenase